ncbi:hypothetical protein GM658_01265 [Pseudoduganella eburnea]|uniref:Uncharacterized protein n=1 Tax=Massilia eburnea TaxID=1776165 RepID=A0A6L6QAV2_9BURK|nr:cytochrome oxidase putative small subunit CydP [Massilia eburnea]MTW09219.1 hypothetical protein [Massilia eburnea]
MKRPARSSLATLISIALVIKVALLYALWTLFFSHPQTKKMRLPTAQVENHLLTAPAPTNLAPKVNDGSRR